MKELILILLILTSGCGKNDKKETMEYIKWLGDQSVNMEIGGDADAYRTLLWAKDQKELSKEKMEEQLKINETYDFQVLLIEPKEHRMSLKLVAKN